MSNPYESPKADAEGSQRKRPVVLFAVALIVGLFVLGAMANWLLTPRLMITPVKKMAPPQQTIPADIDADEQD